MRRDFHTLVTYPEDNDLFYLELRYDQLFSSSSTTGGAISGLYEIPQKSGNIAQMVWRVRGRERQAYSFNYDHLSRLSFSLYYDVNTSNVASSSYRFMEYSSYDNRGNIMSMYRTGYFQDGSTCTFGQIDDLTYTYASNSNRLTSITDATNSAAAKARGFNPGLGGSGYIYDGNGNLKSDSYKGISNITYNHLNLPKLITFSSGSSIEIVYDAAGSKLRKIVRQGAITLYEQDYNGGLEYRKTPASGTFRLEALYHEEGRYYNLNVETNNTVSWRKEYALRDHLGNTRIMFADKNANGIVEITGNASTNEILQENHYYPFGLGFEGPAWMNDAARDNKYQYNGKEWNDDFGLNWNDYGARWYDASVGRWNVVDPLASNFAAWSPFSYTFNNPIKFIDPDGRAARPPDDYYDENGNFLFRDRKKTDFIRIVSNKAVNDVYPQILDYEPGTERVQFLETYLADNSKLISESEISVEAVSKITTDILDKMTDVDASKLLNGKTSVIDVIRGNKFNDPESQASFANTLVTDNGIKITIPIRSGKLPNDLSTVSNIQNVVGAHEFQGHGILGYGSKAGNHSKAYEHQFNHPSWNATTPSFKEYMKENYIYYKTIEKK